MKRVDWFRSQWFLGVLVPVMFAVIVIVGVETKFWPGWTGFGSDVETSTAIEKSSNGRTTKVIETSKEQPGKNLWDLLGLLGVPLALAVLGLHYQRLQQANTDEQAKEEMLQAYFERLSAMLIDKKIIPRARGIKDNYTLKSNYRLKDTFTEIEVATDVIEAWTRSILRRLEEDPKRKVDVLQFLIDTKVLSKLNFKVAQLSVKDIDLVGIDFREANLEEVDFKDVSLTKSILTGANLTNANLSRANLSGANLSGANLTNANLSRANLRDAIFFYYGWRKDIVWDEFYGSQDIYVSVKTELCGADLRNADLRNADLRFVNLERANLERANLEGARMSGTELICGPDGCFTHNVAPTLTSSILCKASLKNLDLTDVIFQDADLSDTDFRGSNLTGADLTSAKVEGAVMTGCQGLSPSDIADLKNRGAIFNDAFGDHSETYLPIFR